MDVAPALSEKIRRRIEEFILDPSPVPDGLRETSASLGALPIYWDMGGCYAVRPGGEIVSFLWDEPDEVRIEDDVRVRNLALFRGSKKCPELELLIVKPAGASVCPHCDGTGREPVAVKLDLEDAIVCYCGGLGWLP